MDKIIILKDSRVRRNIEKAFGVTPGNLTQSLHFKRNGEKNRKMRFTAMQNGGVLLREVKDWNNNDL